MSACRLLKLNALLRVNGIKPNLLTAPADTAILLFAHAAASEAKAKAFASGRSARTSKKIASMLLEHTLAVVRRTSMPLITVYTDVQKGNTFGERLANAFQDAFGAGYQRVICIGSDCPTLAATDLLQAQEALQRHSMVVGPAEDGGAYLIGMHIDCFDPESFAMLNWQTDQVLHELCIYSFRHQAVLNGFELLQKRADVDSKEDLRLVLEGLPVFNRFRVLILGILYGRVARAFTFRHFLRKPLDWSLRELQLRAPPQQAQ